MRRDATARLDRHRREPLMDHAQFDNTIRFFELAVDVARRQRPIESDVGLQLRMREWGIFFQSLLRFAHHGQRIVIHFDQIQCVARDVAVLRHYDRDRMTYEIDPIRSEHGVIRRFLFRHW